MSSFNSAEELTATSVGEALDLGAEANGAARVTTDVEPQHPHYGPGPHSSASGATVVACHQTGALPTPSPSPFGAQLMDLAGVPLSSLVPAETMRVPADLLLQSTPQRSAKAARTGDVTETGAQLMEGTGLPFSPSALRTVALPQEAQTASTTTSGTEASVALGAAPPTGSTATMSNAAATAAAPTAHPTITAWRLWTETTWPLLQNIDGSKNRLAEAAVKFSEELIGHGFHPGMAPQIATYAGVAVPAGEILQCLAAYPDRKNLIPNFERRMFIPYPAPSTQPRASAPPAGHLLPPADPPNPFAPDTGAAGQPLPQSGRDKRPTPGSTQNTNPTQAEPAVTQHVRELTKMLAETRLENDRLR